MSKADFIADEDREQFEADRKKRPQIFNLDAESIKMLTEMATDTEHSLSSFLRYLIKSTYETWRKGGTHAA